MLETGQTPASHGVVRWWLIDLAHWKRHAFGLSITQQALRHQRTTSGILTLCLVIGRLLNY
ncbi:MAG: hypothetical protein HEQ34_06405 [Sphingorhabdus sp.]|jgi:hypothetical protein|uniref:hypothetical protein n=1 Tax=Sphingorhabdus sp. TaxID=1902408 RepID=UPI0025D404DB|nr:hypothetical protein [Sphingorhabdus sp.]MCO4091570.1 hypothetical protein [Sphingorhabdus sp.]